MPNPILARADALMQRRRQNSAESDEIPVLTDAVDDNDVPILLIAEPPPEIQKATVDEALAEPVIALPAEPPPPPAIDTARREDLIRELARRVEVRLLAELPHLIEATVHDFLAEQQPNKKHPPNA